VVKVEVGVNRLVEVEVGEETRGALKCPDATDGIKSGHPAQLLHADRQLPGVVNGATRELALTETKLQHLAVLCSLRERNLISDRAFLIQRRMLYRACLPPAPLPPSSFEKLPSVDRRWWLKSLGIVLLLTAALGIVRFRTWQPANHRAAPAKARSEPAAAIASHPEDNYTLGTAFRLGLYTYTVAGTQTATTLGGQFKPVSAAPGAEFLVVTFTVRNDSIRVRELSTADLKIEDANGVSYGPSRPASAVLRPSTEGSDSWLTDIEPGVTKVMAIAFEVPETSLKTPLNLIVPEQGPIASREASVTLQL